MEKDRAKANARSRKWYAKNKAKAYAKAKAWRNRQDNYVGPSRQAKVDIIVFIKESNPCQDCGHKFPACCMDFDHRERKSKVKEVGYLVHASRSWQEIVRELAKCDLVCANCHRIRTKKGKGQ